MKVRITQKGFGFEKGHIINLGDVRGIIVSPPDAYHTTTIYNSSFEFVNDELSESRVTKRGFDQALLDLQKMMGESIESLNIKFKSE